MFKFSKKVAFTLAEVLITMAIIGVIADAIIPDLTRNIRNKDSAARVRKVYSVLDQAFKRLKAKNWDMDAIYAGSEATGGSSNVMNVFANTMNFTLKCGDTGVACFPSITYKHLSGADWANINTNSDGVVRAKAILNDGTSIFFGDQANNGCTADFGNNSLDHTCGTIGVDINGFAGPNQNGRDSFRFIVTRDGIFPAWYIDDTTYPISNCTTSGNGTGCTAKVLQDNDITY